LTEANTSWVEKVRSGDFSAMPRPFSWNASPEFAHLFDGYELAGGVEQAFEVRRRFNSWLETSRSWNGTATDLWIAIFMEHRGARHTGNDPTAERQVLLDRACEVLRAMLREIGPDERQRLFSAMASY
jgi:hypothetical protein